MEEEGVHLFWQNSLITFGKEGDFKDRADLVKIK